MSIKLGKRFIFAEGMRGRDRLEVCLLALYFEVAMFAQALSAYLSPQYLCKSFVYLVGVLAKTLLTAEQLFHATRRPYHRIIRIY